MFNEDGTLTKEQLQSLRDHITEIDKTLKIVARSEQAGLDVSSQKAQLLADRERASKLIAAFSK